MAIGIISLLFLSVLWTQAADGVYSADKKVTREVGSFTEIELSVAADLELNVSGSGDLNIDQLEASTVESTISGSGNK